MCVVGGMLVQGMTEVGCCRGCVGSGVTEVGCVL